MPQNNSNLFKTLKPEIITQCKKSDRLILQLAEANNNGFRSVLHWFNKPLAPKVMLHNNLLIIANFFGLTVEDLLTTTEPVNN